VTSLLSLLTPLLTDSKACNGGSNGGNIVFGVSGPLTGKISCGEDREPDLIGHETVTELARDYRGNADGGRLIQRRELAQRYGMLAQHFDDAIRGASAFRHDDNPPAVPDPLGDFVDRRLRVATIGLADLAEHRPRLDTRPADDR
jgi:hypothetical protein